MGSAGSDSAGDTGNPLCCTVSPTPGCESPDTESCVCAILPACCQQVWGADCVEQAIACGDPYCSDGTGGDDTTGEPPPELECDPDFGFSPQNPAASVGFLATFSDPDGLTFVGMNAEGPEGQVVDGGHSDTRLLIFDHRLHFQTDDGARKAFGANQRDLFAAQLLQQLRHGWRR